MDERKQGPLKEPPPVSQEPKKEERPPLRPVGQEMLPINEIVNRLEELVRFVLECEGKPVQRDVSFVNVYKQLVQIRESINVLSADQQKLLSVLEGGGMTKAEMSKALSADQKKTISKLHNLQGICEAAKERLHKSIEKNPERAKEIQDKIRSETTSPKQKMIHRKGKFRRLGGKEGWLPT